MALARGVSHGVSSLRQLWRKLLAYARGVSLWRKLLAYNRGVSSYRKLVAYALAQAHGGSNDGNLGRKLWRKLLA